MGGQDWHGASKQHAGVGDAAGVLARTVTRNLQCLLRYPQGDNDPVDVVEIGAAAAKRGGVYKVKPVGVLAMIDDGELDWKVIAISADDPKAALCNDVEDVEK